jgi:hypothetical protein
VFLAAGRPRLRARDWLIGLALLAAPVVPWLIRNAATTGNPVYPLLPSVFPSREWSVALGGQLTHWQQSMGMGRGLADYFLLPWNVAVEGQMGRNYAFFDGILSPLPLAFVPLLILMKNRRPWLMLLALCVIPFIGWAATSQQLRFLIPFLPLTSVATAGVVWSFDRDVLGSKKNRVRALGIACALGFLVIFQLPMLARNAGERVPVVTGVVSKDDYLAEAVQPYAAIRRANELVPRGAKVLMIWENRGYYLERPYLADSFFEASQVAARAAASGSPDGFADGLRADGVTHVIYNHGLGRYFQQLYGPQYIAFLDRFVADHLEPLYSERDVTLYRLK